VIRILLVDDHPALRAGLTAVLRAEPGMVPLGAATSVADLWPALNRTKPDVVILDYHLPGDDGLTVCRQIKRTVPTPAVLLYSAYADASLTIPSVLAGADGIVNKGVPANELFDAIRTVARGERVLPPISRELLDAACSRLDSEDLPIIGMVLDDTPPADVADVLGIGTAELSARLDRMIGRLKVDVPAPGNSAI
jgi:DNA-binding NarL/FixJ family response regulator